MRLVLLAVVSLAAMRVAGASPESDKLFGDGKGLLKAGKLAEACEAFAQSQKLAPKVGTLLNLADCRERQGQTATAWSLFREAKALASETKDKRETEATKRAALLEPRLAYLTLKVAPVEGLVIKRNGTVVDPAAWNQAVPLDPSEYVIEASAPKHTAWSTKQPLAPRERVSVAIALVAEPVAVAVVPPEPRPDRGHDPNPKQSDAPLVPGPGEGNMLTVLPRKGVVPRLRPAAIGLTLGARDGADVLIAGRLLGSIGVPGGALRGIGSVLYTNTQIGRVNDLTDSSNTTSVYAFGLAVDYVWMPVPRFGFAGGIGVGFDYLVRDLDGASEKNGWTALRASPVIARLMNGHVELGLHVQLVNTRDGLVFLGGVGIDVFPL